MAPLEWEEHFDDWDNSFWVAVAPYVDETFWFRLRQRIQDNRIVWYADYDPELGGQVDFWLTLEEAKAATEEANQNIYFECQ